jgi:hypothetical protein
MPTISQKRRVAPLLQTIVPICPVPAMMGLTHVVSCVNSSEGQLRGRYANIPTFYPKGRPYQRGSYLMPRSYVLP